MAVTPPAISSAELEPDVVGADHQDRDPGMNPVDLTVLDSPEDMLRAVAADPEIGRVTGPVEPLPQLNDFCHPWVIESPRKRRSIWPFLA